MWIDLAVSFAYIGLSSSGPIWDGSYIDIDFFVDCPGVGQVGFKSLYAWRVHVYHRKGNYVIYNYVTECVNNIYIVLKSNLRYKIAKAKFCDNVIHALAFCCVLRVNAQPVSGTHCTLS